MRNSLLLIAVFLTHLNKVFFNSDKKVSWYIFSDNERYLCNAIEDYTGVIFNIVIFGILYSLSNKLLRVLAMFFFILSIFDLVHLVTLDMQGFTFLKTLIAGLTTWLVWRTGY